MFTQAIHTAVMVSATALPAGATPDNAQRRAVADVAKGPVEILVTTFEESRGVHKPGTELVASRMLGCFGESELTRQAFLGMAT